MSDRKPTSSPRIGDHEWVLGVGLPLARASTCKNCGILRVVSNEGEYFIRRPLFPTEPEHLRILDEEPSVCAPFPRR